MDRRLSWQRTGAAVAVLAVVAAGLVTGARWRVEVDSGGDTAGNPISHYGPHWLYPTLASVVLAGLIALLAWRRLPLGMAVSVTAFTAGAAANVSEWLVLGGVSNPIGPLPGVHGEGYASIGDASLWLGLLAAVAHGVVESVRRRAGAPRLTP